MNNKNILDDFIEGIDTKAWEKKNEKDRMDILQQFENIMAKMMHRDAVKVCVIPKGSKEDTPGNMGYFDGKAIYINRRFLTGKGMLAGSISPYNMAKALGTIAHEGRHAWQRYVISHPDKELVDHETRKIFLANFMKYFKVRNKSSETEFGMYEAQLMEVDARRFEKKILDYISSKLVYRDGTSNEVFSYANAHWVSRELNVANRILHLIGKKPFEEWDKLVREELKDGQADLKDLETASIYKYAYELLKSKNIIAFIKGDPIESAHDSIDELSIAAPKAKVDYKPDSSKTKLRYRKRKKFM